MPTSDLSATLAAQQQRFKDAVTSVADTSSEGLLLRPRPGHGSLLRIYRHAYAQRLLAALRDNFGVLPSVMGDGAFEALAAAYLAAHPSRHPSIRWFGDGLADFMAASAQDATSALVPHPALVDLARMEWALRAAFDAADAPVLAAAELAAVPPDAWAGLVLVFHPSVQRLSLQWRVEPIWRALQSAAPGEEPELPEPEAQAHDLLVWRPLLETRWRSAAGPLEAELLQAAARGEAFAALCEQAAAQLGEDGAVPAVVALLQRWVAEGLLAGWRR